MLGINRKHYAEIIGIRKEVIEKNFWPSAETKWRNIVRHIKSKRLTWMRYVERMPDERRVKRIYKWKPHATRTKGRPR